MASPSASGQTRVKAVCDGYSAQLASSLAELRHQDMLCDVTIHVGNRTFRAHRAILAASSSYFMGMFTRGFAETHQEEITIEGNAQTFESLLEFAYTGQLPITDVTVYDIITMANYMQFTLARDTALKYVRRSMRISPEDAFRITQLDFLDTKLMNRLQFYLVSEMKELETSHIFLQEASSQYMMELMERKDLTEVNETEVMRTLVAWLHYDWENRKAHITPLLKKVHFDKVSKVVLQEMVTDDVLEELQNDNELLKTIQLQMQDAASPESDMSVGNTITGLLAVGQSGQFRFFNTTTFGGPTPNPGGITHIGGSYTPDSCGHWEDLPQFARIPLTYKTYRIQNIFLSVVMGTLYANAYYQNCDNVVYRYSVANNQWDKICEIHSLDVQLVHLNSCFYFIGRGVHKGSIQRYSMLNDTWEDLQSLPSILSILGFFDNVFLSTFMDKILLYGQVKGATRSKPMILEETVYKLMVYNPPNDSWKEAMSDKFPPGFNVHGTACPTILQHHGLCYRVVFKEHYFGAVHAKHPIVHELNFIMDGDDLALVELGNEEEQDMIPANMCGAFRIDDDVFVSFRGGSVIKTGVKAWRNLWDGDIDVTMWNKMALGLGSNLVRFEFGVDLAQIWV